MAMAIRLAHASFGKDPTIYVASDIPVVTAYLEEDITSAMLLITKGDDAVFDDFVSELNAKFSEQYPPVDQSGYAGWMDLFNQVNPKSLKGRTIALVLKKILGLNLGGIPKERHVSHGNGIQPNSQLGVNAVDNSISYLGLSHESHPVADVSPEFLVFAVDGILAGIPAPSRAASPVT